MRNYIILNGNNSNEIAGLLIQTLPPISQPKIRTNIEEIDGRDGDIITKLGYSAYNKEISIGLYGNYNVDDIIKYFTDNQSGKVTFSNEEDKYYNYEILEQIDFERLIRYKTATVTLHCQPFKYSTTEEKIQINATEVSGTGSNITLNNTEDGALFTSLQINGDTEQDGTPTPSNPVNVNVVTGENTIEVLGKNLADISKIAIGKSWSGVTSSQRATILWIPIEPNQKYNLVSSWTNSSITNIRVVLNNGSSDQTNNLVVSNFPFTNTTWEYASIEILANTTFTSAMLDGVKIMLCKGEDSEYEPYASQTYPINLGKNLFNNTIIRGIVTTNDINTSTTTALATQNFIQVEPGKKYTISYESSVINRINVSYFTSNSFPRYDQTGWINNNTITIPNNINYILISFKNENTIDVNINDIEKIQIERGSTATSYSPYFTPIELCKIGDYQDYIYKENGNWYIEKNIGKVVLNGSESWEDRPNYSYADRFALNNGCPNQKTGYYYGYSNYFEVASTSNVPDTYPYIRPNNTQATVNFTAKGTTTLAQFKTWLSTHNTLVYYVLSTPTTTQITDTTLLSQLEALASATTYLGQTNIITSGSDLNPILEVTTYAVENPSFTITNNGNIFSKPIITIYGLGTVGLYLNGIQVLSLDMGETTSQITIDVAKMEAYNQETGALMNRSVTGDYNNLSLNVGENTITESGTLQGIEIENYSRWL